jgi:hypothetical protein
VVTRMVRQRGWTACSSSYFSGGPSGGCAFVAHTPKSSPSPPLPPPLVGGRAARAVDGSDRCGGTDGLLVLIFFRGPEWWMRVRRPRTKVVAVAATTAATRRWTGGARGRRVGSVWGNGRHGVVLVFFRGPEWWRRVRCPHTEVIAFDTATAATHRWRAVRAVEGSDRCWGTDGMGSSSFSGAGVGSRDEGGLEGGVRLGRCEACGEASVAAVDMRRRWQSRNKCGGRDGGRDRRDHLGASSQPTTTWQTRGIPANRGYGLRSVTVWQIPTPYPYP